MAKQSGVLRCVLCDKRFTEEDVATLSYFVETSTCFGCYKQLSKNPFQGPKGTCFGKLNKVSDTGKILGYGYDPLGSSDCAVHCPHRKVCPLFAKKEIYKLRQFLITPFTGDAAKAMQSLLAGCSRLRAKTVLSIEKVRKDVLRLNYGGKKWVVDRTKKAYKAYFIKEIGNG